MGPASLSVQFYRALLDLHIATERGPLLEGALRLFVELASARVGFIELRDANGNVATWRASHPLAGSIAASMSRGIADRAVKERRTIISGSASVDPRFKDSDCVLRDRIGAIICTPIGSGPCFGVLFLRERIDGKTFTARDVEDAEIFARQVEIVADAIAPLRRSLDEQLADFKERVIRKALARNEGNKSRAAKELGIGRAFLYKALERK